MVMLTESEHQKNTTQRKMSNNNNNNHNSLDFEDQERQNQHLDINAVQKDFHQSSAKFHKWVQMTKEKFGCNFGICFALLVGVWNYLEMFTRKNQQQEVVVNSMFSLEELSMWKQTLSEQKNTSSNLFFDKVISSILVRGTFFDQFSSSQRQHEAGDRREREEEESEANDHNGNDREKIDQDKIQMLNELCFG